MGTPGSCSRCSGTRYFLRVRLDTVSPAVFLYIFREKLQMKQSPEVCALASGAQPREMQVVGLGHRAQPCRGSGKECLDTAALPKRILPLYPSSASQQSFREHSFGSEWDYPLPTASSIQSIY